MRVTFDPEADAVYIYLKEIAAGEAVHQCLVECDEAAGMIVLDLDSDGRLIGIEVLSASAVPQELLDAATPEP